MNTPTWEKEFNLIRTMDDGDAWVDRKQVKSLIHRIEQEAREDERRKALSIIKKLESRTGSKSEGV